MSKNLGDALLQQVAGDAFREALRGGDSLAAALLYSLLVAESYAESSAS